MNPILQRLILISMFNEGSKGILKYYLLIYSQILICFPSTVVTVM